VLEFFHLFFFLTLFFSFFSFSVLVDLSNGQLSYGSLSLNGWAYYSFTATDAGTIHIQMKELSSSSTTSGLLWLYVSKEFPTLRDYEYSDTKTNSAYHRITIALEDDDAGTYYIGVYGNPYMQQGQTTSFQIVAFAPFNY
jgi:hypothetical protein